MKSTIRFSGTVVEEKTGTAIVLPKAVKEKATVVEGVINAFPIRAAIKDRKLIVTKGMRAAAKVDVGDTVPVELTRFGDESEARVPADLAKALKADVVAQKGWDSITPMARRDWILSITTPKQEETRRTRIEKALDMLSQGKRRLCCFPGINWITKDHDVEPWIPLPKK